MTLRKCLIFSFADIEVRERELSIVRNGESFAVEPKAFRVLLVLLNNPHKAITKDELLDAVWNETSVSENSLTRSIALLRRLLGDDPFDPRYIATVPTVGYRFICEVAAREEGFGVANGTGATLLNGEHQSDLIGETVDAGDSQSQRHATGKDAVSGTEVTRQETNATSIEWSRKRIYAALTIALLILPAGFILRNFFRSNSAPAHSAQNRAMERRLTSNPSDVPLQNAVISRDGKYLAYADATGLYLREISSGETRPWSLPKGFVARPESWFPDGTHLLALRIAGPPQVYTLWKPSLYKLSTLGGAPQLMMSDAAGGDVSPDGLQIAYLPWPGSKEIWIMNADGADPRMVVSGGGAKELWNGIYESWIHHVAWSPTGHHFAYIEDHAVAGPMPVGPTHVLRITDPNGAGQTKVLDDSRIGDALWWAPDGRILFAYDEDPAGRQSNYGVYSIRVDEHTGKAVGPPQPVTQAEGRIRSMSGTADGKRLVVSRRNSPPQVFIAGFDAASHRWNEPRRLILDANLNIATAWTADSKSVLFISNRNGPEKLFRQAIDETTPEVLVEGRSIHLPRLSADGSQVLYLSSSNPNDVSFPVSLMSKPLAGGAPRVVVHGKGIWNHQCAYSPATRCIFSQLDGQNLIFRSFDLEHGEGRELLKMVGFSNWSLSSDGSKLAIIPDPHHIRFVSLDTGAAHDVTVQDWVLNSVDWGASGQTLFMPSVAPNGLSVILEVDLTGKAKVILTGSANTVFAYMIQSPDSRYALLGEFIPTGNNAWIVDDF